MSNSDLIEFRLRWAKIHLQAAITELRAAARKANELRAAAQKAEQSRVLKFTKWDFKGGTKLRKLV